MIKQSDDGRNFEILEKNFWYKIWLIILVAAIARGLLNSYKAMIH